jgi:O-acetyl-ADP-ribose deacetylase (regulator of RNase III)
LAAERNVKTISFPSISTGIYGYPIEEAAEIAVRTVANWLSEHAEPVNVVKLVQYSSSDHEVYRRHAQNLRGSSATAS